MDVYAVYADDCAVSAVGAVASDYANDYAVCALPRRGRRRSRRGRAATPARTTKGESTRRGHLLGRNHKEIHH